VTHFSSPIFHHFLLFFFRARPGNVGHPPSGPQARCVSPRVDSLSLFSLLLFFLFSSQSLLTKRALLSPSFFFFPRDDGRRELSSYFFPPFPFRPYTNHSKGHAGQGHAGVFFFLSRDAVSSPPPLPFFFPPLSGVSAVMRADDSLLSLRLWRYGGVDVLPPPEDRHFFPFFFFKSKE